MARRHRCGGHRRGAAGPSPHALTVLRLPAPLDLPASLRPFARWGDDRLDRWDGRRFLRVLPVVAGAGRAQAVGVALEPGGDVDAPTIRVTVEAGAESDRTMAAIPALFVQPERAAWSRLLARDPVVRSLDGRSPGVRPVLQSDLLASLVRSISAQQVNLRWAATIRARLAERYGVEHRVGEASVWRLDAEALAAADPADLRALQLTTRKGHSVIAVARAVADGTLSLAALAGADDATVIERLDALPGIGRWSAEWFLARTLGRAAVVTGDLGVRKAVGVAYLGGRMPSEEEVREVTSHWGESATVAQHLLLHALAEGELGTVAAVASPGQVERSR